MKTFAIILSFALFAAVATATPETYTASADSHAVFEAVGKPGIIKIQGQGAKVLGELRIDGGKVGGIFDVDLRQFQTGIDLRDRHMREKYLETATHPKAQLEISAVDLPDGWQPGADAMGVKFRGRLTLKGVAKPVAGEVSIKGAALASEARFGFSLGEFPIGVPSYMGITVADTVNVSVQIPGFTRKSP